MDIWKDIEAGLPTKARPLAKAMGVSPSLIYDMISRGEIEAKRIGQRRLVIPNGVARKLLDLEEGAAALRSPLASYDPPAMQPLKTGGSSA